MLADFGISHIMTSSVTSTTTGVGGSVRWMAVELLAMEAGKHTKQTDVWAYGMVIYVSACFNNDTLLNLHDFGLSVMVFQELLTGFLPFFEINKDILVALAIVAGQKPSTA